VNPNTLELAREDVKKEGALNAHLQRSLIDPGELGAFVFSVRGIRQNTGGWAGSCMETRRTSTAIVGTRKPWQYSWYWAAFQAPSGDKASFSKVSSHLIFVSLSTQAAATPPNTIAKTAI
jgi:hypothetical protein